MNWLVKILLKEAQTRRFRTDDRVRYFTDSQKGKGKGVVLTPRFNRGTVLDFDSESRRYRVKNDRTNEEFDVHPRNLIPDSLKRFKDTSEPVQESIQEPVQELLPVQQVDTMPALV